MRAPAPHHLSEAAQRVAPRLGVVGQLIEEMLHLARRVEPAKEPALGRPKRAEGQHWLGSRTRSSHHCAASSFANFKFTGTLDSTCCSCRFDSKVRHGASCELWRP